MTKVAELSDKAADKLQAVLNHGSPAPVGDLLPGYSKACAQWFAGLNESDKATAATASWLCGAGEESEAVALADALPPAPKFSLP